MPQQNSYFNNRIIQVSRGILIYTGRNSFQSLPMVQELNGGSFKGMTCVNSTQWWTTEVDNFHWYSDNGGEQKFFRNQNTTVTNTVNRWYAYNYSRSRYASLSFTVFDFDVVYNNS